MYFFCHKWDPLLTSCSSPPTLLRKSLPQIALALPPPWSSSSPTVTDDCCVTFTRLSPDIPIGCSVFFFSEELVGTCSDTSSNNLLKSVHHHYRVRSAVVCREWERGSENWRLNGRRSAAGSDSTRWKKSSSAPLLMTRFFLDYLHSCSLLSFIRSCLCLCIDAFLGTTQTHIILSPVALLHFWFFFYSLNYCFTKLSSHDTCWYPKWAMGRVGGGAHKKLNREWLSFLFHTWHAPTNAR